MNPMALAMEDMIMYSARDSALSLSRQSAWSGSLAIPTKPMDKTS
jgi:hypothetical protein